jgi:hypothetical protein
MSDPNDDLVPYDAFEDYDAADEGPVIIPEGTAAILYADLLDQLAAAGFKAAD